MSHRELIESLAAHLGSPKICVWTEIPLGSVWLSQMSAMKLPRADVLTMAKSFTKPTVTIYEVKESVSDFRHDVHDGKYLDYFKFCNRLYFACAAGTIPRGEVPDQAGLITLAKQGSWATVKGAVTREYQPDTELLIKLAIDPKGVRNKPAPTREERLEHAIRYHEQEIMGQAVGRHICIALSNALEKAGRVDSVRAKMRELASAAGALIGYHWGENELESGHYGRLCEALSRAQIAVHPENNLKALRYLIHLASEVTSVIGGTAHAWQRNTLVKEACDVPEMIRELVHGKAEEPEEKE